MTEMIHLHQFPIATVTDCHKLSGLKQYKRALFQLLRSGVYNQGVCRDALLLETPGETSPLALFSFLLQLGRGPLPLSTPASGLGLSLLPPPCKELAR